MLKRFQFFIVLSVLLFSGFLYAEKHNEIPSEELLEFLMEYGDTDDETFDMIIQNGVRDNEQAEIEHVLNQKQNDISEKTGENTDERQRVEKPVKSEV
ncbi:MAG: hypothetical protein K6L80_02705 [Agarilytica sp.]